MIWIKTFFTYLVLVVFCESTGTDLLLSSVRAASNSSTSPPSSKSSSSSSSTSQSSSTSATSTATDNSPSTSSSSSGTSTTTSPTQTVTPSSFSWPAGSSVFLSFLNSQIGAENLPVNSTASAGSSLNYIDSGKMFDM